MSASRASATIKRDDLNNFISFGCWNQKSGGVKKVFGKSDDVNVKPSASAGADVDLKKEFHSKTGDTLKSDMAFAESILKDKAIFLDEFDLFKPGPLVEKYAETFSGYKYKSYLLKEDTILYRSGTSTSPFGNFYSFDIPKSEIQVRVDKAIMPKWKDGRTSPIDTVFKVKIPRCASIHVGDISYQDNFYLGGTHQIVIPNSRKIPGIEVLESYPIDKR